MYCVFLDISSILNSNQHANGPRIYELDVKITLLMNCNLRQLKTTANNIMALDLNLDLVLVGFYYREDNGILIHIRTT